MAGNPVTSEKFTADPCVMVHHNMVYLCTGPNEATAISLKKISVASSESFEYSLFILSGNESVNPEQRYKGPKFFKNDEAVVKDFFNSMNSKNADKKWKMTAVYQQNICNNYKM